MNGFFEQGLLRHILGRVVFVDLNQWYRLFYS
jgi:hypothetical protein